MALRVHRLFIGTGALALLLAGSLAPARACAQQALAPLQFSFSDPGARSMGFGGAFVALADDATAAFANPAGLVQLLRPEFSIEGRSWSYSTPFTVGGRVEGLPSGLGIDTTAGLRTATSEDDIAGLSFLSVAYPKENWSFAFFRHEAMNLEFFSETQGFFGVETNCCPPRFLDQRAASDMKILSYGLSAAYRISDKFSLGVGLVYQDASFVLDATLFLPDEDTLESSFAPNSYLPERSLFSQRTSSGDADWTLTGGILWRLSETWSIGGVYRQAPKFGMSVEGTAGGAGYLGAAPGTVLYRASGIAAVEFPEIRGLGFAYRHSDGRLTASFQWDRVEYSNVASSLQLDDQKIDDIDELHLGAEYVFLGSNPIIAVRLGTWWEPDHQPRATIDDPLLRALLPPGEDEMHYSAGLGVAMQSFQIDLGVDFADRVDTVSLSAIYNF